MGNCPSLLGLLISQCVQSGVQWNESHCCVHSCLQCCRGRDDLIRAAQADLLEPSKDSPRPCRLRIFWFSSQETPSLVNLLSQPHWGKQGVDI